LAWHPVVLSHMQTLRGFPPGDGKSLQKSRPIGQSLAVRQLTMQTLPTG
jgi:hypothetical protein